MNSWLARGLALVSCWLTLGAVPLAQERTVLERLDALLDALDSPGISELLEPLGEVPELEQLLTPMESGEGPASLPELSEEVDDLASQLADERDRLADEDPIAALDVARELTALLAEELGPDHGRTLAAGLSAQELEARIELAQEDWERVIAGRKGLHDAVRLFRAGEYAEALENLVAHVELEREFLGAGARLAAPLGSTAAILHGMGEYTRAERVARAGLKATLRERGAHNGFVARSLNDLALLSTAFRRFDDAEALHAHSLALRRELYGDLGPEFALALMHLAQLYRLRGDIQQAADVVERAIVILKESGTMPELLGILLLQRGTLEWTSGDEEGARRILEDAIATLGCAHGGDHAEHANALGTLADLERGEVNLERARELAGESLAMLERLYEGSHPSKAIARHRLAMCLEVLGELDRAEEAYREALVEMEASGSG